MKSVLLLGEIMFYSRIFNSQAQSGTKGFRKIRFKKMYLLKKSQKFMMFDMLPELPIILYCIMLLRKT